MVSLIIFLVIATLVLAIFLIQGYKTSPFNQVDITRYLPCPRIVAWELIKNIEQMPIRRGDIKKIEALRQHHDEVIEWIAHTSHGGYLMLRMEDEPFERISMILTSSTFGVTGRWDYTFEECGDGVNLTIEENSIIPSFWYRMFLYIRGRHIHLEKEICSIVYFIQQKNKGSNGRPTARATTI